MARKSMDAAAASPVDKIQKKTERSHEENQERAYIAASRRTDRSLEARVQSAKMASEIHKKRTGKGFKVSEAIVVNEEMYEEEEDDIPRAYRSLAAGLQLNSADLQSRMSAFLSTNVAMRSLAYRAHQDEIERRFDELFPGASQYNRRASQPQSAYAAPFHHHHHHQQQPPPPQYQQQYPHQQQHRASPQSFADMNYAAAGHRRSQSTEHLPVGMSPRHSFAAAPSPGHTPQPGDVPVSSPPELSTGSVATPQTPTVHSPDSFDYGTGGPTSSVMVDPALSTAGHSSNYPFTTELPNEVKQLATLDWNDPMTPALLGAGGDFSGMDAQLVGPSPCFKVPTQGPEDYPQQTPAAQEYFNTAHHLSTHGPDLSGQRSTIGTPGGGAGGDSWEAWVKFD